MQPTSHPSTLLAAIGRDAPDEADIAVAAFLARYSGRTRDAYRHDLRSFFQWANDVGLDVLAATRPTSSCSASTSKNEASPPPPSIAGSPRCAASTGSRTSTGASPRTPRSTCAARRSIPPSPRGWTGRARHVLVHRRAHRP